MAITRRSSMPSSCSTLQSLYLKKPRHMLSPLDQQRMRHFFFTFGQLLGKTPLLTFVIIAHTLEFKN